MSSNARKLPKHIVQMVEKNNLVMAIKTLAKESNISMTEAKDLIDSYEAQLKSQQEIKTKKIVSKQQKVSSKSINNATKNDHTSPQMTSKLDALNTGLDKHLEDIGYQKPLLPYWAKRVFVILSIIMLLCIVFWQLVS